MFRMFQNVFKKIFGPCHGHLSMTPPLGGGPVTVIGVTLFGKKYDLVSARHYATKLCFAHILRGP